MLVGVQRNKHWTVTPVTLVPFLGGYISCPSHETPPEEKTRERTERSVDGCRMKRRRRNERKCKRKVMPSTENSGKEERDIR